jgi:multidrug resistance efflux pump
MSQKNTPFRRRAAAVLALSSLLFLGACASKGAAPTAELSMARASITQAEAAGAGELAPVELLAAREKLGRAESAVRAEDFSQARRLSEQAAADADADLAERKSRADKARRMATEMGRSNDTLQREIKR